MTGRAPSSVRNEWALPYFDLVRTSRFGVLVLGGSLGLMLTATDPRDLLGKTALVSAVFVVAVGTGLSLLPGFRRYHPGIMTAIALLDLAAIGLFGLLPGAPVIGAAIVLMPALWLAGALGLLGVAVTALATSALVAAPALLVRGTPDQGLAWAVSTVLFATLSAAAICASNEMTSTRLLRLNQQGDELRTAMRVKDDFIALVSHELRTPLTSIIGYLDLVTDGDDAIPDEARRHLSVVSRNADRLLLLVTDLLSAVEAETAPMRLMIETVDTTALAQISLDDAHQRAAEAGLTIVRDLDPGVVISADPNRFLQILDNLLSNAIKFTPPGGRVSVKLRRQRSGVDLVVTDSGVGIDELSLPHLGTKFFRAPKTTEAAIPGIGLGLMMTRAIVEAHHGSLTFTSHEGVGTSVLVHLPTTATQMPVAHLAGPTVSVE